MPNIPSRDFIAIKTLLLALVRKSEACWRRGLTLERVPINPNAIRTRGELRNFRKEVKSNQLKTMTDKISNKMSLDKRSSILLLPLEDDSLFVPLLTFEIDSTVNKANFRVDLFTYDEKSDKPYHHTGYRFETPTVSSSKHLYFHVQPIDKFDSPIELTVSRRVPGTVPCIPVRANGPVSLVLSIIVSLYGREVYNELLSDIAMDKILTEEIESCFAKGSLWKAVGWK